jgi:hypothetical protein
MAENESRTIAEKLQIKGGNVIRLIGSDAELAALLDPLPEGAVVSQSEPADAAVIFVTDAADLRERLFTELDALRGANSVWIAYRKGNATDFNRNGVIAQAEHVAWNTVSNVSLGDTWSAVRIKPVA